MAEFRCENGELSTILRPKPVKTRRKKTNVETQCARITDFFPVRRSERMPLNLLKKQETEELERRIICGQEGHLAVCQFEGKGRGVKNRHFIPRGEFVVEYKGELVERHVALQREKIYSQNDSIGCYLYYFDHARKQFCVDATAETPFLGRLVNHSMKRPNCCTKIVEVGGVPRLILVALRNIEPNEELLYNYGERDKEVIADNPWLTDS